MPTIKQIDRAIDNYQNDVQFIQNEWILSNPRFKQVKLGEFQGLDFIEVHEYLTANDEIGYVVIIHADEPDGIYYKSINFGPETTRTVDWQLFDPNY